MDEDLKVRLDRLAEHLDYPKPRVRMWKSRGYVPGDWHHTLVEAAGRLGIPLTHAELDEALKRARGRLA